jgi:hypothetical protein
MMVLNPPNIKLFQLNNMKDQFYQLTQTQLTMDIFVLSEIKEIFQFIKFQRIFQMINKISIVLKRTKRKFN